MENANLRELTKEAKKLVIELIPPYNNYNNADAERLWQIIDTIERFALPAVILEQTH